MTWTLLDGEERHRVAPRHFFIPPAEQRSSLKPGRLVKLGFECDVRTVDGEPRSGERMWVEVLDARPDGSYVGRLSSQPRVVTELQPGQTLEFEARHVIAISYDEGELGYDHQAPAYVDARLRRDDRPADYFTYQSATPEGEKVWWGLIDDERPCDSMTLGDLTDRWPQLAEVFQSAGGWWKWDAPTQRYVQTVDAGGATRE